MSNEVKKCLHCSTEFSGESSFCCRGCETAYKIIQDFGLKKFYDFRKSETNHLETKNINSELIDFTQFAKKINDKEWEIELSIRGIKCGSCVWLIEKALQKYSNVKNSRVNFSTAKLYINWQGDISEINNFCQIINQMGYATSPYEHKKIYDEIESEKNSLLKKLIISGFAIVAVMMFSDGLWEDSRKNIGSATHDFLHWILILIGVPAIIYSGSYFFSSAIKSIKSRAINMDVPIASSILVILLLSFYQAIIGDENFYLDSAIMLIFSLLVGRYLELQARCKAKASALEMVDLLTGFATKLNEDGSKKVISSKDLQEGDLVVISAGEKIPSDGVVSEGESEVDSSVITGETLPKPIKIGQAVYAGMINLASPIKIIITKKINDSQVAKILNLLESAEKSKTGYSLLAEKATKFYIPLVYGSAFFTIILWYFFLGATFEKALICAASVLIITCPCALGLAIPVVNILAFGKLFKNGIMLKNGEIIEKAPLCNKIIFDKTGTLTEGNFKISNLSDFSEEELKIAASLAVRSKHMLSRAISESYNGSLYDFQVTEQQGQGLFAYFNNQEIKLGKPIWCGYNYNFENEKYSNIIALKIGDLTKIFRLEDKLREDAPQIIKYLKKQGLEVMILSGDIKSNVENIANKLAIEKYFYEKLPEEKYNYIKSLKAENHKIIMVGDGLNDAPSIALADVSISPGSAVDITQNYADIIFKGALLNPVLQFVTTSKTARNLIKQNIYLSFIYNFLAIPYAISGFMTPLWAAVAMSLSSLIVILNSLRLSRS